MLVVILTVFAFCWLPFQVAVLYSEHRSDKINQVCTRTHKGREEGEKDEREKKRERERERERERMLEAIEVSEKDRMREREKERKEKRERMNRQKGDNRKRRTRQMIPFMQASTNKKAHDFFSHIPPGKIRDCCVVSAAGMV